MLTNNPLTYQKNQNKMRNFLSMTIVFFIAITSLQAQNAIKKVFVETYYVSDNNDATDTTAGNYLPVGSKTYRIFVQLEPGYKLQKIYGDNLHPLVFKSTQNFFNNKDYGTIFGKDIPVSGLRHNTVALDSWITLGQVTKASQSTYFGILKAQDTDGSIIAGGINNDGGSAEINGGLLKNSDPKAGVPLTTSDGMDTLSILPANWSNFGFSDSSIFGALAEGKEFTSYNAYLQNSGVSGINSDSNQVLIAQLTTKGEISFEINLEVSKDNQVYKFIANDIDSTGEITSPYLKYPPDCGCTDPEYKEYSPKFSCSNYDSCKTRIVIGCMDPNACNYDPTANYNISSMCCYPGNCGGRDLSLVCPDMLSQPIDISVYPNPANSEITIQASLSDAKKTEYVVINAYGNLVIRRDLGVISGSISENINISDLFPGIYMVRLIAGDSGANTKFIKN
jgi:hypothetical protein